LTYQDTVHLTCASGFDLFSADFSGGFELGMEAGSAVGGYYDILRIIGYALVSK